MKCNLLVCKRRVLFFFICRQHAVKLLSLRYAKNPMFYHLLKPHMLQTLILSTCLRITSHTYVHMNTYFIPNFLVYFKEFVECTYGRFPKYSMITTYRYMFMYTNRFVFPLTLFFYYLF